MSKRHGVPLDGAEEDFDDDRRTIDFRQEPDGIDEFSFTVATILEGLEAATVAMASLGALYFETAPLEPAKAAPQIAGLESWGEDRIMLPRGDGNTTYTASDLDDDPNAPAISLMRNAGPFS